MLAGLDDALALAGDGEGAVEHGLLDSGLHVLVEGCPIRSEGGCVAEGEDYESTVDLVQEQAGKQLVVELRGVWARDLNARAYLIPGGAEGREEETDRKELLRQDFG